MACEKETWNSDLRGQWEAAFQLRWRAVKAQGTGEAEAWGKEEKEAAGHSGQFRDWISIQVLVKSPRQDRVILYLYFFSGFKGILSYTHIHILLRFHWSVVAFQCYVSFYCIAKWISSVSTSVPSVFGFPSHLGHHRDCYTGWSKPARKKTQILYISTYTWKLKESVYTVLFTKQAWRHRCREQHLYLCFGCCGVRGRTRSEGERPAPRLLHQPSLKGMAVGPWMHVWKPWELNPGEASLCRERRTGLPISRQQRCGTGVSQSCQRKHQ